MARQMTDINIGPLTTQCTVMTIAQQTQLIFILSKRKAYNRWRFNVGTPS